MGDTGKFELDDAPDPFYDSEEPGEDENRCVCENPENKFVLSIEEGGIYVHHAGCGRQPWWMLDDFNESVSMDPLIVTADVTGTTPDYYGEIDGPQVSLFLIKEVTDEGRT